MSNDEPNDELIGFGIRHCEAQTSGFVLRRPVTRSPSFHWPRFLRSATRSKRLSVFRFAPNVLAARKLRCCAINRILRSHRPNFSSRAGACNTQARGAPVLILPFRTVVGVLTRARALR